MISLHFDFTEVGALVIENQLYLMQPMNGIWYMLRKIKSLLVIFMSFFLFLNLYSEDDLH